MEPPRLAIINLQKKKRKEALQNIQTSPEPEGGDGQGGLFQRERLLHPPDPECLHNYNKDRKPLSPAASRLHWMHMASDKPILPVVTASVSTTTNASPVPSAPSETQADTLLLGLESSDLH